MDCSLRLLDRCIYNLGATDGNKCVLAHHFHDSWSPSKALCTHAQVPSPQSEPPHTVQLAQTSAQYGSRPIHSAGSSTNPASGPTLVAQPVPRTRDLPWQLYLLKRLPELGRAGVSAASGGLSTLSVGQFEGWSMPERCDMSGVNGESAASCRCSPSVTVGAAPAVVVSLSAGTGGLGGLLLLPCCACGCCCCGG